MGQTLPSQHPAVVLRSHFNAVRALLAVALIAVVGLTVAVVILASDEEPLTNASRPAIALASVDFPLAGKPIVTSNSGGARGRV